LLTGRSLLFFCYRFHAFTPMLNFPITYVRRLAVSRKFL
jgi:hypothetical protein